MLQTKMFRGVVSAFKSGGYVSGLFRVGINFVVLKVLI